MAVITFPHYNLFNIPEALRKVANEIEAGEVNAARVVLVLESEDGDVDYRTFGDHFQRAYAVGLLWAVAGQILPPSP